MHESKTKIKEKHFLRLKIKGEERGVSTGVSK